MTTNELVQQATLQLPGIGLSDDLITEAVEMCERDLAVLASKALRAVVSKHLKSLTPPKQASRKMRSTSAGKGSNESEDAR